MILDRGKKIGTLYVTLNGGSTITITDVDEKLNIWHQELGHMREKGTKVLLPKGKLLD